VRGVLRICCAVGNIGIGWLGWEHSLFLSPQLFWSVAPSPARVAGRSLDKKKEIARAVTIILALHVTTPAERQQA
jgi:hypothetical protein